MKIYIEFFVYFIETSLRKIRVNVTIKVTENVWFDATKEESRQ